MKIALKGGSAQPLARIRRLSHALHPNRAFNGWEEYVTQLEMIFERIAERRMTIDRTELEPIFADIIANLEERIVQRRGAFIAATQFGIQPKDK